LHARSACHNRPRCRDPARSGSVQVVDGLHNSTHPRRRSPRPLEFVGFEVRQLHRGRSNMTMHAAGTGGVKDAEPSPTLCRACHELIDAASSLMINVDYLAQDGDGDKREAPQMPASALSGSSKLRKPFGILLPNECPRRSGHRPRRRIRGGQRFRRLRQGQAFLPSGHNRSVASAWVACSQTYANTLPSAVVRRSRTVSHRGDRDREAAIAHVDV
jgi:hypothetical protein